MLKVLLACSFAGVISSSDPLRLTWVSQPVLPGETAVVSGSGFTNTTIIQLTRLGQADGTPLTISPLPGQVSPDGGSLKFVLPPEEPLSAYDVVAKDGGNGAELASNVKKLNFPDIYWAHGDEAEHCTPGGYIRIFGKALHFPDTTTAGGVQSELRSLERQLDSAMAEEGSDAQIASLAVSVARARRRVHLLQASATTLKLEKGGEVHLLQAAPENISAYSAFFRVPSDMPLGQYHVSLANELAPETFSPMSTFLEPSRPIVTTIQVQASDPYPEKRFIVTDYNSSIGNVPLNGEANWVDSSSALRQALADAKAAGGGVVYFPRGQYFLNSTEGFTVPWNVRVVGESRETVSLYLPEMNVTTAPPAYFRAPGTLSIDVSPETAGTGRWSVEDLTVYVTGFHDYIFYVNNHTIGWTMRRTRVRANSWLGSNGPFTARDKWSWKNWTILQPGAIVGLSNCRNWQITENDLFGDGAIFQSFIHNSLCAKEDFSGCHGAAWGLIADNTMWNTKASHFMNQWNQVIFERNLITGISPLAMGNSVGTGPGGGYDQHIYHGENRIQYVHGNDREIITFDDAGGAYFGTVASVSGTEVTLGFDARSSGSLEWGSWGGAAMVVLNGTGVGQWRRITVPGIGAESWNANNRTWKLDKPFDVDPGVDAVVQVTPFRGRLLFHGDSFVDGGNVQFYGQAFDIVVANCIGERMAGFYAWGQWKGCQEFQYCGSSGLTVTGEHGNGMMPNVQIQYINNTIVEGNKIVRFTAHDGSGTYKTGLGKFMAGATFLVSGGHWDDRHVPPGVFQNMQVIFRRNVVQSNGGFSLGGGGNAQAMRDVLVEGNVVKNTNASRVLMVGPGITSLLVRNNDFPKDSSKMTLKPQLAFV